MGKAKSVLMLCALAVAMGEVSQVSGKDSLSTKAVVKRIKGYCYYQTGNSWSPVRVNMQFDSGVVFRTDSQAALDLSVNGITSALRIDPDTIVAITQMDCSGEGRDAETTTTLDLRKGAILGEVKKLHGNSRYEIKTPHGIAGIVRSPAGFHIVASLLPDDKKEVTFTSVSGQMLVSAQAMPNSPNVVKTLKDGRSWTPGEGDIHRTSRDLLRQYQYVLNGRSSLEGPTVVQGPGFIDPFGGAGQPSLQDSPTALAITPGNSKK